MRLPKEYIAVNQRDLWRFCINHSNVWIQLDDDFLRTLLLRINSPQMVPKSLFSINLSRGIHFVS